MEHQTGKFLARANVVVEPIAGTPGGTVSMRTNISGLFEFSSLTPGTYVIKVSRPGFMPVEYGQKRWNSAGAPLVLDDSAPAFLAIRLPRWGAISGTVVDENDIGLPEHDVVAYRNTRPPQLVARARSDERGVYRISGLEPGTYLIRTAGAQYEEGAYLPTFGRESIPVENARLVDVDLDQQANNIDVRPFLGKLFTVSGGVIPDPPDTPTKVTLATDMGRQTVTTVDGFQFAGLTPGAFEIYAEAPANPDPAVKLQGAYLSSTLSARTGCAPDSFHQLQPEHRCPRRTVSRAGVRPDKVAGSAQRPRRRRRDRRGQARKRPRAVGARTLGTQAASSCRLLRIELLGKRKLPCGPHPPRWLERNSRERLRRLRPLRAGERRQFRFGNREGR